ncbi:carbohydrate ABC transporter substrate-binding protein, partial [Streptomyces sp. SID7982]|nr:carbohydrate ABC transporter substrate-binding protein [Streptomyces sp. SID7982]
MLLSCTTVALALGATACGGDPVTTAGGGDKSLSGQTVSVAGAWSGAEQKNFQKVLDAFSAKTGAKTQFTSTGDNVSTVVGSKIEGGNAPDVALVPQVGVLQQFAKKGWLKPLSASANQAVDTNYADVWKSYGSVDGTLYGLYFKAAHKSTVWYSPAALSQAGVKPPKTYKEMLASARTVSDSGLSAFAVAGEDGWALTDWFENIYLSQAGPEKYDQLAAHEIKWTDPSVVRALTTLGALFSE